jgi:hypothetical protein
LAIAQRGVTQIALDQQSDQGMRSRLIALEADLVSYVDGFRAEATLELDAQFNESVAKRLGAALRSRDCLCEIHELEVFAADRDIIQFFLDSVTRFFPFNDYTQQVQAIDDSLREFISEFAVPRIAGKLSPKVVAELDVSDAPAHFWWRHLGEPKV